MVVIPPMKIIKILLLAAIVLSVAGCARLPSNKGASHIIKGYFHKYGRQYPDTVYKKNPVKNVEITEIKEIHKNMADTTAFITLKNDTVQRVSVTLEKRAFLWKVISWENLSGN